MMIIHEPIADFSNVSLQRSRSQGGSTLMEVLIALVVLSFGLLGQAGLQAATLKVNQGALMRSQATTLAYDILDRMRANRNLTVPGGYDNGVMGGTVVSGGAIATLDIQQWQARLGAMLPSGTGLICRTPNPVSDVCAGAGDFVIVSVQWVETDEANKDRVVRAPVTIVGQL